MYGKLFSRNKIMNRRVKSSSLILSVLVISVIFIIFITTNSSGLVIEEEKVDILCHFIESNVLGSVNEISPAKDAIFFHETSCRGDLDYRQACSVESAAIAHPEREIYVIFSAPVERATLESEPLSVLQKYPNVKFKRVLIQDYAKGTPAEQLVKSGNLARSRWIISHTSDVLRYLTLYKYSGVYLDLDTIVVKSLNDLPKNFVTRENDVFIASFALAFSDDELGRTVANLTVRDLGENFDGSIWGQNGPMLITRVLKELCGTDDITLMSAEKCKGFEVYSPDFLPLQPAYPHYFFEAGELKPAPQAYIYHIWNKQTHSLAVDLDSPYAKLSKQYCPVIYETFINNKR